MERINKLKSFLENSPNDPFLQYALALEYLKIANFEEALRLFEQLIEQSPGYVGTYYHLGKLQEQLEQPQQAMITYQKGIEIATHQNDRHSASELRGAYNLLCDELEEN